MSKLERVVKAKVNRALERLRTEGYGVYRFMPVPTGFGMTTLDYIVCVNGQFIGIETKRLGKTMTPRQEQTAMDIHAAGGIVFVVDGDESLTHAMKEIRKQCQLPSAKPRSNSSSRRSRR